VTFFITKMYHNPNNQKNLLLLFWLPGWGPGQGLDPIYMLQYLYRGPDKSLARPTSRCILFDGKNISFDASLVIYIYINSTNIPPVMIINRIDEKQNLLSL
jgi:hypothetical protein